MSGGMPLGGGLHTVSDSSDSTEFAGKERAGEATGGSRGASSATCTSEGIELHREGANGSWDTCRTAASGLQRGPDFQMLELETL